MISIAMAAWRDSFHPKSGGAERYTNELLTALSNQGHQVSLVTSRVAARPLVEEFNGYSIHRVGDNYSVYRNARSWIRTHAASLDLVVEQVNTIPFRLQKVTEIKNLGALVFQTCEDIWPFLLPFPASSIARRYVEPRWLRSLSHVPTVTLSESTRNDLLRMGLRRVTAIAPGGSVFNASPVTKFDRPTIIHVGRLVGYKRVDHLIASLGPAIQTYPNLDVLIVGDGPELKKLRRAAPACVRFLGHLPSTHRDQLVSQSHLQVVTSVREGWGLVVTEAAALGTPTLSYSVSGLSDSTSAAGGWLCPPSRPALEHWLPLVLGICFERGFLRSSPGLGLQPWPTAATECMNTWLAESKVIDDLSKN